MPTDIATLKNELKQKDREIKELKEMLAESEAELKEYTSADNLARPRASILESTFLNKAIKSTFFILLCAIILMAGLYPWLFKDDILGGDPAAKNQASESKTTDEPAQSSPAVAETDREKISDEPVLAQPERDIFQPEKNTLEVVSDLGWLNVRTEPNAETGKIIKKINNHQKDK